MLAIAIGLSLCVGQCRLCLFGREIGCFCQEIEVTANGSDGGAQFVGGIGYKALLLLVERFQSREHLIKGGGKNCQFIPSQPGFFRYSLPEIASGTDTAGCPGHTAYWREDSQGDKPATHECE